MIRVTLHRKVTLLFTTCRIYSLISKIMHFYGFLKYTIVNMLSCFRTKWKISIILRKDNSLIRKLLWHTPVPCGTLHSPICSGNSDVLYRIRSIYWINIEVRERPATWHLLLPSYMKWNFSTISCLANYLGIPTFVGAASGKTAACDHQSAVFPDFIASNRVVRYRQILRDAPIWRLALKALGRSLK